MDRIGIVGLSYRHAAAEDIACFTIPKDDLLARLPALRETLQTAELMYLATCNRVEVLFAMPEGVAARDFRAEVFRALLGREPAAGEARSKLRAWVGEAAVEHLFLVACGLDSAQAGEREIAAQLRAAWETAREAGVCGALLDRIVGEALSTASHTQKLAAGVRPPSLADLAAERVREFVASRSGRVALVGVSPMTRRCGELLHEAGFPLLVVNRSLENAQEFAATVGAEAVALERFREKPVDVSAIVVATGGTGPVLDEAALARIAQVCANEPLIVDFGVPPNADVAAARRRGFPLIGMDELIDAAQAQRIEQLMRLAPVRAAIDERLARLREQMATRAIGRQLAGLRDSFERIATDEVERLLEEEMPELDPQQAQRLRRFAITIARRLAHLPLAGMRAAAAHANAEAIEAFFREARLQRTEKRTHHEPSREEQS